MEIWKLILLAAGAIIIIKFAGQIVEWAKRVIREAFEGIKKGVLYIVKNITNIIAYVYAVPDNQPIYVDEIVIDEADLPDEILQTLYNHNLVKQDIYV